MPPSPLPNPLLADTRGLLGPERRVSAAAPQKVRMAAAFDDAAGVQHQDLVGVDDRGEAMSDNEAGMAFGDFGQRPLDGALSDSVE